MVSSRAWGQTAAEIQARMAVLSNRIEEIKERSMKAKRVRAAEPLPVASNGHAIAITTWRRYNDDDDSLHIAACPAGDTSDVMEAIAEEHGLEIGDEKGQCFSTGGRTITDGDVLESGGRRFRVFITEL